MLEMVDIIRVEGMVEVVDVTRDDGMMEVVMLQELREWWR